MDIDSKRATTKCIATAVARWSVSLAEFLTIHLFVYVTAELGIRDDGTMRKICKLYTHKL